MKKLVLAAAAAAAMFSVALFGSGRAEAMAVAPTSGLQALVDDASIMHDVRTVCRHRWRTSGRRCWWVPGPRYHRPHRFYGHRWHGRPWGHRRWRHR